MVEPHWTDTAHLFRDYCNNSINIENPHNLNDADVPTEESRIESQAVNTEETPNERAEEERSQSNDNEHETHQVDPTSREATIAYTSPSSTPTQSFHPPQTSSLTPQTHYPTFPRIVIPPQSHSPHFNTHDWYQRTTQRGTTANDHNIFLWV